MKSIFLVLLLSTSSLFAQKAPFAAQSDLILDLSDSVLDGIFHHRLGFDRCAFERNVWLEGFGSYRQRQSTSERSRYHNWLTGILGGFNYAVSCDNYLNFFAGASWGEIDIRDEPPHFDTDSILFGMTWERLCENRFFGLAIAGGFLSQKRTFSGVFGSVKEEPQGVFITPELAYSCQFDCMCVHPIFSSSLRYAGFFAGDYQHRETLGTLYVKERSIQLLTLRGELAAPLPANCFYLEPYLGFAGRFQFDGNHIKGRLSLEEHSFSDGIDNSIGYGFLGFRASERCGCWDLQANFEGSYDTDCSWRTLGELTLNYVY